MEISHGDEAAAKNLYIAKRVEQIEADENFQIASHTAKIHREIFNDEISRPRLLSKTLLLGLISLLFLGLLYVLSQMQK